MIDIPRSNTETLISATRVVANWHRRAAFDATTEGDAADHETPQMQAHVAQVMNHGGGTA